MNVSEKGKGKTSEESPFLQALMALKAGLQASPAACEGFTKALLQLSGMSLPSALHFRGPNSISYLAP